MTLKKLVIRPGVVKTNTDYAEPGRYIDAQWVRFIDGLAEKMGGYVEIDDGVVDPLTGVCRNICEWRGNSEQILTAFGTHSKLMVLRSGALEDITPFRRRVTGTLTNAISTTSGSTIVTVDHTAHSQQVGDWVQLTAASSVGGVLVAGVFQIETVPDADSYTIDTGITAGSSSGPGGGSIAYTYYRLLLGTDPFTTASGSSTVVVADTAHGAAVGDTVIFGGATAVAGLTIDGAYIIVSTSTDTYTINADSAANASTTGGGSAVTAQYEINIGRINAAAAFGYGVGTYGSGTWGTARTTSVLLALQTWSLWAYGSWLLANPRGGALYKWDPEWEVGTRAVELYNAPTQQLSFFVTEERYIISLGKDGVSLQMGWPDQLDPTAWTSTEENTANESRKVQGGNFFVSGTPVRQQTSIVWTDLCAFLHQWRADDYIFTTTKLGEHTGLIGPNAYVVDQDVVYWVTNGRFLKWDGAISELQADDIRDWFFENLDADQRSKIVMGSIARKGELIVLYQESGQSENNRYLLCRPNEPGGPVWSVGRLERTAWLDQELLTLPIATNAAGVIYEHETGLDDAGGQAIDAYITTGPMDIDDGNASVDILGFLPDIRGQTDVISLFVLTRERSVDTPTSDGPYTIATTGDTIDLRSSGAMVGYKIESETIGGDFRLGVCRIEFQPGGARRS